MEELEKKNFLRGFSLDFKKFRSDRKYILGVVVLIAVLIFLAVNYYKNQNTVASPEQVKAQQEDLVKRVGNLILLPNETPEVATVTDRSQLPNNSFFANAQNGDRVLVYRIAQQAIIYRPSINKIISVSPINTPPADLGTQNSPAAKTATPSSISQ